MDASGIRRYSPWVIRIAAGYTFRGVRSLGLANDDRIRGVQRARIWVGTCDELVRRRGARRGVLGAGVREFARVLFRVWFGLLYRPIGIAITSVH